MKKLEKLNLTENSEISTSEMKQLKGGHWPHPTPGDCCVKVYCGPIRVAIYKDISHEDAMELSAMIFAAQSSSYCGGGQVLAPPSCGASNCI